MNHAGLERLDKGLDGGTCHAISKERGANMTNTENEMERSGMVSAGGDRGQASPRFVVVVPPDRPDVYEQLTHTMEGENVRVVIDRRRAERREHPPAHPVEHWPLVDRRRTYRRGQSKLSMTAAHSPHFQARGAFSLP